MELADIQRELKRAIQRTAEKVASTPTTNWTLGSIESRLELLDSYWRDFHRNHGQLLTLGDASAVDYRLSDTFASAEELYVESRGVLLDHQVRCTIPEDRTSTPGAFITAADHGTDFPLSKLPRLELPTFSGKPEDWEAFRDLFVDLVHDNATLGEATKINYLKTNVKGAAEEALRSFRSIAINYKQAWEALCRRYDQPKLRVRDHLAALVNLRPLIEETPEGLQILMDELNRCRTQLERLNQAVQTWDVWFVFMGVRALDPVTKRAWEEEPEPSMPFDTSSMTGEASFRQFTEFLQRRYCTLRALGQVATAPSIDYMSGRRKTAQPIVPRTIRTHATGTVRTRGGCPACKEAYYVSHCITFRGLEPEERRKLVAARGLCYNCLGSSHTARNCPSNNTCRSCAGDHHTLIH
ncbi:uncharacterized protein LOC131665187 [Phymastichus coffea]|uniref:uncharacterized protein LOC131665187 n=1 Tax=Phymastichus coffea TaxID=108790 RepID=UPI00273B5AEC|nr:uncharacterized protein LOC131665187 [Phymastichus coffea]